VIVPAYNAAATLAEQLEALAAQRFDGDWELVIVDKRIQRRHRGSGTALPPALQGVHTGRHVCPPIAGDTHRRSLHPW
jgi:hypothetical protein